MHGVIPVAGAINPYNYFSQPISGKMEVPVAASQSIYANFQFVQGVASSEGGVSLERLKVIDSLLAQINAHRQSGTQPLRREQVNLSEPDQAIAELSAQVHQMQKNSTAFDTWDANRGLVINRTA